MKKSLRLSDKHPGNFLVRIYWCLLDTINQYFLLLISAARYALFHESRKTSITNLNTNRVIFIEEYFVWEICSKVGYHHKSG
jgi:hypothetical protein